MTDLATHQPADLAAPLDKARAYAEQATAPNTRAAYRSDWQPLHRLVRFARRASGDRDNPRHARHTRQRGRRIADRAILLIGFAGAFRRSELVALDIADLQFTPAGVVITLRRSKTHQEGRGMSKGIPMGLFPTTCPVRALRVWIEPLSS
jgi:integrase